MYDQRKKVSFPPAKILSGFNTGHVIIVACTATDVQQCALRSFV